MKCFKVWFYRILVPRVGLEPTHGCPYQILSLARLPVSPPRQKGCNFSQIFFNFGLFAWIIFRFKKIFCYTIKLWYNHHLRLKFFLKKYTFILFYLKDFFCATIPFLNSIYFKITKRKKMPKVYKCYHNGTSASPQFFLRCANETPVQMIFLMSLAEHWKTLMLKI